MERERIGPYLLERKLGAGGMGVVWAAWDERLGRRVALKQIRPEAAGDPVRRERFRREARAVAQLDHPSIVRIHDLFETPDGDWLVLQYVEGITLAERLRQGPLSSAQVVSLARDVLGALEAAHAQGLLHRDLKAENVILAPSGRAMVLDFGLAKLYAPDPLDSPTLPATAGVVGTFRAMSPEQANGLSLDPRSDLFSLGVLLYEAATGVSPFQAGTPVETLTRVCTHLQPPARELVASIPEPVSGLIDALLEKDANRRPRSASEVLSRIESGESPTVHFNSEGTISKAPYRGIRHPRFLPITLGAILIATVGLVLAWRLRPPREPLYVAVARPEIGLGADREEVALAASALQAASLRTLTSLEGIAALAPDRQEPGEPALTAQRLARLLAADEVLTSTLDCQEHHCLAVLRRLRGTDGRLLNVQTFEIPLDDFQLLDTAAATYLKQGYDGFRSRLEAAQLRVRSVDYERFLRVQRTWEEERPADLTPLLAELGEIRAGSPLFVDAYLLEGRLEGYHFFDTRDAGDLDRALDLLGQARSLAPEDPRPLLIFVITALPGGRLDEAEQALRELEERLPGDIRTLQSRAFLSEQRGDGRQALVLMRSAAERHPSVQLLSDLANMAIRQGEIPEAKKTLESLLQRVPGYPRGEKLLAQLELEFGSPARAAELYGRLVRRQPTFGALSNLGLAQFLLGRYDLAAVSLRQAHALAPHSPAATLNLADAEMLRGQRKEAEALYRRVLELVEQDPAPAYWQTLSTKAQAEAHLGRAPEAAATIQKAIVAAPDNPQIAFEASLVYTVIGDTASALASAERALARGLARRWFALPWFDSLRKETTFRELLELPEDATTPAAR
jgi:eukaryotic-like serine/threonine-protein kinase